LSLRLEENDSTWCFSYTKSFLSPIQRFPSHNRKVFYTKVLLHGGFFSRRCSTWILTRIFSLTKVCSLRKFSYVGVYAGVYLLCSLLPRKYAYAEVLVQKIFLTCKFCTVELESTRAYSTRLFLPANNVFSKLSQQISSCITAPKKLVLSFEVFFHKSPYLLVSSCQRKLVHTD